MNCFHEKLQYQTAFPKTLKQLNKQFKKYKGHKK